MIERPQNKAEKLENKAEDLTIYNGCLTNKKYIEFKDIIFTKEIFKFTYCFLNA